MHTTFLVALTADRGGEGTTAWRAEVGDLPPLDELGARAVEHGDEHVIKFTEACLREYALRPDPRYPAAALAAHRRIERLDSGGAVGAFRG